MRRFSDRIARDSRVITNVSPGPEPAERLVELGTAGELPARLVDVDLVALGRLERVALAVEVLVAARHAAVADMVAACRGVSRLHTRTVRQRTPARY
jgi:hypothetical protein